MLLKKFICAILLAMTATGIFFCGELTAGSFYSETLGEEIGYNIYLPDGYGESDIFYPVVYLLHGRGGSKADWLPSMGMLDSAVENGQCVPVIAVMPDAPYYSGGSYYVNSDFGTEKYQVETAFTRDLIEEIDSEYRTINDRTGRIICGFSMGGYGALRYALEYPEIYAGAIVLSPAVYNPVPPIDSSAREFGAFGKDDVNFIDEIYVSKNYTSLKKHFESFGLRSKIFIMVGDDEWQSGEYEHDLDFEAHTLYKHLQEYGGMDVQLRIVDGGHDWDVWGKGFESGLSFMKDTLAEPGKNREITSGKNNFNTEGLCLFGNEGEDTAGGLAVDSQGNTYLALNVEGGFDSFDSLGAKDIFIIKLNPDMETEWVSRLATPQTEKAYALRLSDFGIIVTGYTKGDMDGMHPGNSGDDVFAACVGKDGVTKWIRQFGDSSNADRGYALAISDETVYVSGYTKGSIASANKGDKDIFAAALDKYGNILWKVQLGTEGEEKCQGMAADEDGNIYLTGLTSGEFTKNNGDYDIFVACYGINGEFKFVSQYGTSEKDEAYDMMLSGDTLKIAGLTAGNLAAESLGDKDVFLMEIDKQGNTVSSRQFGTNLNDKGVKIASNCEYDFIACISDGQFVRNEGKFDTVIIRLAKDGVVDFYQFGSFENDGADDWAEGNLFIEIAGNSAVISGITYGSLYGKENKGSSDIFTVRINPEK